MLKNLYVDNVITGYTTPQEAAEYYHEARSIMSHARFNLRAWASNCTQLNTLAQQDSVADSTTLVNILGLQWNIVTDTLQFVQKTVLPCNHSTTFITKRQVLQQSSKVFDPLGYLAPVTIRAKLFLQKLWQSKIKWDVPLQKSLQDEWCIIAREIEDVTTATMPRHYFTTSNTKAEQLHVFADASFKAYGAVPYLLAGDQVTFIVAKSRVTPVKA